MMMHNRLAKSSLSLSANLILIEWYYKALLILIGKPTIVEKHSLLWTKVEMYMSSSSILLNLIGC